ncbi:cyclic pyranopterin phosphate synthase MoaA [Planctomycetaceae bacterium SCGC AG-212-F19]|nr:cyclic pyranopterin phosphate synthase MoaA [Planctomycetaceae bacterium SCGC AG-212-F19]
MPLLDTFGRAHNNLRISVTDRCNLRCTYCMPEDVTFMDKHELLTFEEITRFVRAAVPLGIDKIRLTGGEPLMRRDLPELVRLLTAIPGIKDVGLTTNGMLLAAQAEALHAAGLRRINISLDTLDELRFRQITRRPGVDRVIAGIHAAKQVGFRHIKLNAVSMRGITEHEVVPLARFARAHGLELRFIEYMPIGADHWEREKVYFAHEIMEQLEQEVCSLAPAEDYDPRAPAMDFVYTDGGGRVGIIASVSRPFCARCNRIRLTADGKLRNCLFALDEVDVKDLLRQGAPDEALQQAMQENVWAKWEGHEINTARFVKPLRTMHAIGG